MRWLVCAGILALVFCVATFCSVWWCSTRVTPLTPPLSAVPEDVVEFFQASTHIDWDCRRLAEVPNGGAEALIRFWAESSDTIDSVDLTTQSLEYAADGPAPVLLALSRSEETQERAFAAAVMGGMVEKRYQPRLRELITDTTPVPHWHFDHTIGEIAQFGLLKFEKHRMNWAKRRLAKKRGDVWIRRLGPESRQHMTP